MGSTRSFGVALTLSLWPGASGLFASVLIHRYCEGSLAQGLTCRMNFHSLALLSSNRSFQATYYVLGIELCWGYSDVCHAEGKLREGKKEQSKWAEKGRGVPFSFSSTEKLCGWKWTRGSGKGRPTRLLLLLRAGGAISHRRAGKASLRTCELTVAR